MLPNFQVSFLSFFVPIKFPVNGDKRPPLANTINRHNNTLGEYLFLFEQLVCVIGKEISDQVVIYFLLLLVQDTHSYDIHKWTLTAPATTASSDSG